MSPTGRLVDLHRTDRSPDGAALARVAGGDISALAEVYDRHAPAVMRFAARVAGRDDAEDLVQATFMKAADIASRYDERAADARAWLFGITAKLASERRRALTRFGRALGRLARGGRRAEPPRGAERLAIERALAKIAPQKRVALVLAEVEGYTCEQIAELLEVPVGTVWTRLHHAKKELRAIYEADS